MILHQVFWKRLLIICISGFLSPAKAGETYDEYQLKAAITYNIARFVQWPVAEGHIDAGALLMICVLGSSNVASGFASLEGKLLGDRLISIKYLQTPNNCNDGQILFAARFHSQYLADVFAVVEKKPVLTINDMKNFTDQGGAIE